MAEDATPLVEALLSIIDTARAYLPPDGISKDAFIARVLQATDNPRIIAALAAHGHPVAGRGSRAVPTINLTADELAAVTAALRRAIEDDRFPHAPRLDPLRAALGSSRRPQSQPRSRRRQSEARNASLDKPSHL
jgi:hypothetical protein